MKQLNKERVSGALKVYGLYWESYLKGDLETFASTLDEEFETIGTSVTEVAHNKADGIKIYKAQMDEIVGMVEMRNRVISAKNLDEMVLINETCDIYVLGEPDLPADRPYLSVGKQDGTFYSKLRLSTLLHETASGWKVIQQHGSLPDMRVQEGETLALEKITKENLELRDAVKRRTIELENKNRELAIEAALEKVRTVAMGMKKPEDMLDICCIISEQLQQFGVEKIRNIQTAIIDEEKGIYLCYQYFTPYDKVAVERTEYLKSPVEHGMVKQMLASKDGHFTGTLAGKDLGEFREHRKEENHFPDPLLDETQEISYCFLSIGQGGLGLTLYQPIDGETLGLFTRFHQVFSLAYSRFQDIEKAQARAREVEIELALERVRAMTMAMHNSEDVGKCIVKMFAELTSLGVDEGTRFGIGILNHENENNQLWTARKDGEEVNMHIGHLDMSWHPLLKSAREAWKAQVPIHKYVLEGEDLLDYYRMLNNAPDYKIQIPLEKLPKKEIQHCFIFEHGFFYAFTPHEFNPDLIQITKRFSSLFEQTYRRYLDLVRAEAQAREAQIEAALERVRSKTMAMHSSEDVDDTVMVLFDELVKLGVDKSIRSGIGILSASKIMEVWTASTDSSGKTFLNKGKLDMRSHPLLIAVQNAWEAKETTHSYLLIGEDLRSYFKVIHEAPEYNLKVNFDNLPDRNIHYDFFFPEGLLFAFSKEPFTEELQNIFQRFSGVFGQTYTRFLDLQKAEAQAREAKIEVALEKVRSRTMGMQKSDELADVAHVLFQEMNELVHNLWTCGFVLCEKDRAEDEWWLSLEDGFTRGFFLPNVNDYAHAHLYEGWLKKDDFRTVKLEGDQLQAHYDWLMEIPVAKSIFDDMEAAGMQRPEWQKLHAAYFSKGYLVIITREPCAEEAIFKRFAQVFDLTYTRFLDLKKAEEQARESQIEASLEKVRSRSLAMQSPAELIEVAQVLREEMGALGVEELETSSIYIHDENSGLTQCWFTIKNTDDPSKAVTDQMTIDLQDTWVGRQMLDFYRSPENQTSILMQGANRKAWIQYCEEKTDLFGTSNFYGDIIPERTYHLYKFSNGYIGAAAPGEISKESWDLLKRATAVFSFAYTRFQDLQKAEASAIAAMRQASLDRIRADISSMRNADDLERITPLIFKELTVLGVPFIRCGVFIIHEKQEIVEAYLSSPDGNSLGVLKLPYQASELTYQTVEAWRKGEVYRQHWNREDFVQWIEQLMEQDQILDSSTYQGSAAPPESLDLHFVPFTQGMLYVGAMSPLDNKELELVQALAKAFSIAFARYEDFVKLEKAKAEVESAMSELKATQAQLIQQEKLASLGQLTAGIAHEIKNPLNFVNNFSEVSIEMIEEIMDSRHKTQDTRHKTEDDEIEDEILEDIRANLKKIHEHGSRANGIVTSMLQHSRGGTGKKEPTDLNALIKEYVNLSFHGMRAGKNPINLEIILDLDPEIKEISLIREDFTRVIINLCNNAFDAMRATSEMRPPKLTIRTKHQTEKILIAVEDNGPGIPDDIKDKILQPFFTTKKGTEGTGLGLSITNDIIKAHGGELKVETSAGKSPPAEKTFTEFTILLPS